MDKTGVDSELLSSSTLAVSSAEYHAHRKKPARNRSKRGKVACPVCRKTFKASQLKRHKRTHTGVRPYECSTCGKTFSRDGNLKIHVDHVHLKKSREWAKVECPVCRKMFFGPSKLKLHERTHTGIRPFECSTCGKTFSRQGNLKAHQDSVHLKKRRFRCPPVPSGVRF